ncbi:MAG: hypothetical protein C4520_04215 [Candidatus Abyssobacteria bacterium SURF_5]|uniref:Uncharacterized protein n=1 Tax=Abyssobacteria bacterium (strain SURF_5) TaxID=2093360 RepID=A0A3A4P0H3_ABYX5|nr:MAG: hypothetical protein C4520_04215 [Candidatus Abyssubacteria bacterium SURF_5]
MKAVGRTTPVVLLSLLLVLFSSRFAGAYDGSLSTSCAIEGTTATVCLVLDVPAASVKGVSFKLTDTPDLLHYSSISGTACTSVFLVDANESDNVVTGLLVSLSGSCIPAGSCCIAEITYNVDPSMTPEDVITLTILEASVAECATGASLDIELISGECGCAEPTTYYRDMDEDTYGLDADSKVLCAPEPPYTALVGGDCDDGDALQHPGAVEVCNLEDDDCDLLTDEPGAQGCSTYFRDEDDDGYGVDADSQCLCAATDPYTATIAGDCDDGNPARNPGATEICTGGIDEDCDGLVDGADTEDCGSSACWTEIWTQIHDSANGDDTTMATAIDSQGNIIAAGTVMGLVDHGENAYLVKYDPDGNLLWTREVDSGIIKIGGTIYGDDSFVDVCVDSHDNIIAVGGIGENFQTTTPPRAKSMLMRKYAPDGTFLLEKRYFEYGGAWATGCAVDGADNIYVTGNVLTDWTPHAWQWATLKYDSNFNLLLGPIYYNYSTSQYYPDHSHGIAVDSAGNMIVVGCRGVSGCEGCEDYDLDWHIRKYAPSGVLLWSDTQSGPALLVDFAWDVDIDSNDDIIVAGTTNKGTDNDVYSDYDWRVIKYSKDGAVLWTYLLDPSFTEESYDVAVDVDDNALVAGYIKDAAEIAHWHLKKLEGVRGNELCAETWNGSLEHEVIRGVSFRDNTIALGGNFHNGLDYDMRTKKLETACQPLSQINLLSPANGSVHLYPPSFCWTPDGTCDRGFAVDFSASPGFKNFWSTYDNLHMIIADECWPMPMTYWNKIPAGSMIFWRVRGADVDLVPLAPVLSQEIWSIQKQ